MKKSTPRKLTEQDRADVLTRAAHGASSEECAAFLQARGLDVSSSAVRKMLQGQRSELADASKVAARSAIGPSIGRVVSTLAHRHRHAVKILRAAEKEAELDPMAAMDCYAKAVGAWAKVQEAAHKAAGLDQPDDPVVDGVAALLGLSLEERERAIDDQISET